jgi:phenylalanyl-tRNA synthetase beta chain
MRVPLSWLREFVPVEADADELAAKLSVSGFAVEEILKPARGVSGVVIGEVREVRDHPNSDKLVLVRVFDGSVERDIVCGARNFREGDRVPIAVPGAKLPGGVEIGSRKVAGEVSDGMLCSARELELSDDHSGIMVLDADSPLGEDIVRALALDDVILHLDVTTNRGDALSIVGIAREVAALYGLPLTVPEPAVAERGEDAAMLATVRIEDARGCPRYLARVITGVRIGPSPFWMQRRLMAAGMRPISNVVDVTNYVLLERGQPLHAFDLDTLTDHTIVVRKPRKGERITTLDGIDRALTAGDVAICDADRPVAVAGVMGGAETEVTDKTGRILLESAYFDPLRIRATAGRMRWRSEASIRFERGADPEGVPAGAARACELLAEIAGATIARGAIDVYPKPVARKPIRLRVTRANGLLGTAVPAEEIQTHLRALGCEVVGATRTSMRVTPPTWRPDLSIEADLIEEVARLHGLDAILETLPSGGRTGGRTEAQRRCALVRTLLLGAGLSEANTLSLLPPWLPDRLALGDDHAWRRAARVANPLSEDESVLRPSLLPGLLLATQRNVARHVRPVALFEIGTTFHPDGEGLREQLEVAWILSGPAPDGWHAAERELDFFDAKGVLETVMAGLGVGEWSVAAGDAGEPALLHPGRSAAVRMAGRDVGFVAELTPRAAGRLEIPGRVAVGSLTLAALVEHAGRGDVAVPSRFPPVTRDLALVVPEDVPAAEVERAIRGAAGPVLAGLRLFDVYRGEQVPEGQVSLAFALTLQDPERTLTDAEADAAIGAILDVARARAWSIRA